MYSVLPAPTRRATSGRLTARPLAIWASIGRAVPEPLAERDRTGKARRSELARSQTRTSEPRRHSESFIIRRSLLVEQDGIKDQVEGVDSGNIHERIDPVRGDRRRVAGRSDRDVADDQGKPLFVREDD